MKGASRIFIGLLIGIIILAVLILLSLNAMIVRSIQTAGSHSLGVEVKLSEADLSVLDGSLTLSDLRISNPEGFSTDHLFTMKESKAMMRPTTVLQEEITIDSVVLESALLTLEQSIQGTNIAAVLQNIQNAGSGAGKPGKQKLYRIRNLRVTGAEVTFASMVKPPVTVRLPELQIENVSSADGGGLVLAQVFEKIFVKMIEAALKSEPGAVPSEMMSAITADVRQFVPEFDVGVLDKMKGFFQRTGEGLKNLFDGENHER